MEKLRLGVNIDHVATLRNARGAAWPDPLRAALLAEAAGADGYQSKPFTADAIRASLAALGLRV